MIFGDSMMKHFYNLGEIMKKQIIYIIFILSLFFSVEGLAQEGQHFQIQMPHVRHEGQLACLDIHNGQSFDTQILKIIECKVNEPAQQFVYNPATGYIQATAPNHQGYCLDVPGRQFNRGQELWLYQCHRNIHSVDARAQQFDYDPLTKRIRLRVHRGLPENQQLCLSTGGERALRNHRGEEAVAKPLQLERCADGVGEQQFHLSEVNQIRFAVPRNDGHRLCMDVINGSYENHNRIQLLGCRGSNDENQHAQRFVYEPWSGTIRSRENPEFCMDIRESRFENGGIFQIHECNETVAQKFFYDRITNNFHLWANPNYCVDVSNSENRDGALLQAWWCNGTMAQKFFLTPLQP